MITLPTPCSQAARQKVWAAAPASNISQLSPLLVEQLPSFSIPLLPFTAVSTTTWGALVRVPVL